MAGLGRRSEAKPAALDPLVVEVEGLGPTLFAGPDGASALRRYVRRLASLFPRDRRRIADWGETQSTRARPAGSLHESGAPVIGILLNNARDMTGVALDQARRRQVIQAVRAQGGVPVLLPPGLLRRHVRPLLEVVDHLVIAGGQDLHPAMYGERLTFSRRTNLARDRAQRYVFQVARDLDLGIDGICLGMQSMNAYLGGSSHQDLRKAGFALHRKVRHPVLLTPGSRTSLDLNTTLIPKVWSAHHQGFDTARLAAELRAVGFSPDGVVEVVEGANLRGVQFHPEARPRDPFTKAYFGDIVARGRAFKAARPFALRALPRH